MKNQRPITTMKIFNGQTFTSGAGLIKESVPIDLREIAQNYSFSIAHRHEGAEQTVKLEVLGSYAKDGNYVEIAADIIAAAAAETDYVTGFTPSLVPWMKIRATAAATIVVLTAYLNIQ